MKHHRATALALMPVTLGLVAAAGPTYAGTARSTSTSFAFQASGFGTRVIGGQVPVGSDTTGYQVIGCTNQAGKSRTNDVASATIPGLGQALGVRTHVWTSSHHGVVATHSTHSIAELVLAQSQLGTLEIDAISSRARAYHDKSGFHATTATRIGGISFTPAGGSAQSFPAPTPDQPLAIPGVATIYAGRHLTHTSGTHAAAYASALRVDLVPSGTTVQVAKSSAQLNSGMLSAVFAGHSAATHVLTAGGGILESGPNPLNPMPCMGTYGKTLERSLASIDLGGQLVVKGATTRERAAQTASSAHGMSRAAVAELDLGGGQLVVQGIVGKATVRRTSSGRVVRSDEGTQVGTVTVNGQEQTFPATGVIEIPGVAKLERDVVTRTRSGMFVIGLRVTLLDGSGAVVNLAEAKLRIHPLG